MLSTGGRSQWFLLLALVFGLLAAGLTWVGLQQIAAQPTEARGVAAPVSVVVTTRDIPPRTVIAKDMVEVRQIPQGGVHDSAVKDLAEAVGKSTRQTIYSGEQVLYSKLFAERAEAGLAFTIPAGKRAVSVSISEVTGSGGLILPGDHVDVVGICRAVVEGATKPAPGGGNVRYSEQLKATTVLQDVEVLAVAQLLAGTEPQPSGVQQVAGSPPPTQVPRTSPQAQPTARTVTMAVGTGDAQRLILYDQLCDLILATRRFDDRKVDAVPSAELNYGVAQ